MRSRSRSAAAPPNRRRPGSKRGRGSPGSSLLLLPLFRIHADRGDALVSDVPIARGDVVESDPDRIAWELRHFADCVHHTAGDLILSFLWMSFEDAYVDEWHFEPPIGAGHGAVAGRLALPPATEVPPITTTAIEASRYSLPMSSEEPRK